MERTLVLVKPDGVRRAIVGEVMTRFEHAGLKVVGLKMLVPTKEQVSRHYTDDNSWLESVGKKTIGAYKEKGLEVKESPVEVGKRIRGWLMESITSGPVIAMVLEGNEAIAAVRKLCGSTAPIAADPSTIRGMFSTDSYGLADEKKRVIRNIIHASDARDTAEREIAIWFGKGELHNYKRVDEDLIY